MNRYELLKKEHEKKQRRLGITGDEPAAPAPQAPEPLPRHSSRHWLVVPALCLALAVGAGVAWRYFGQDADSGLSRAAERYKYAVGLVVVEPENAADGRPMATAWALGPTRFASCAHVVEQVLTVMQDGGRAYIALNSMRDHRLYVTRAALHGRYGQAVGQGTNDVGFAYDVGLLEVEEPVKVWFPVAGIKEIGRLRPGYRVASLGYPMERLVHGGVDARNPVAVMQSGIITAVSNFRFNDAGPEGNMLIRHNLGSTGGSSGSPLFNARGEVVGIVNAGNVTLQVAGLGEDGRPVIVRAPSAAMVNFAQRVDMLEGVAWHQDPARTHAATETAASVLPALYTGMDAAGMACFAHLVFQAPSLAMIYFAQQADVLAAVSGGSPLLGFETSLACMAYEGSPAAYTPPPVAADFQFGAAHDQREIARSHHANGAVQRVDIVGPAGELKAVYMYHDNGQIHIVSPRRNGRIHGMEVEYTRANRLLRRTMYENGRRHGVEEIFNIAFGFIERRTVFKDGAMVEPTMFFDRNGALLNGKLQLFYINSVGTNAEMKMRYEECPLVNGRRHGTSTSWYRSGAVKAVSEYRDGRRHGSLVVYHENGQEAFRGMFLRDVLHGECVWFDKNGREVRRGVWRNGGEVPGGDGQ